MKKSFLFVLFALVTVSAFAMDDDDVNGGQIVVHPVVVPRPLAGGAINDMAQLLYENDTDGTDSVGTQSDAGEDLADQEFPELPDFDVDDEDLYSSSSGDEEVVVEEGPAERPETEWVLPWAMGECEPPTYLSPEEQRWAAMTKLTELYGNLDAARQAVPGLFGSGEETFPGVEPFNDKLARRAGKFLAPLIADTANKLSPEIRQAIGKAIVEIGKARKDMKRLAAANTELARALRAQESFWTEKFKTLRNCACLFCCPLYCLYSCFYPQK